MRLLYTTFLKYGLKYELKYESALIARLNILKAWYGKKKKWKDMYRTISISPNQLVAKHFFFFLLPPPTIKWVAACSLAHCNDLLFGAFSVDTVTAAGGGDVAVVSVIVVLIALMQKLKL